MASSTHFDRWQDLALDRGQQSLSHTMRALVYRTDPVVFDLMDFTDDRAFLNPLLFAWYTLGREGYELYELTDGWDGECLPGTCVGWSGHTHPLFERLFSNDGQLVPCPLPPGWMRRQQLHVMRALALLGRHCPSIAQRIAGSTQVVQLFQAPAPNSFASLSAHGAVFLNVPAEADEVFFLEDLAHQCSHVAFNAMTHDKARYLRMDPALPLARLTGRTQEQRSLYTVLHALYTYVTISEVLGTLLDAEVFDARQSHEAAGRLAYTLLKFKTDLRLMDLPGVYTGKGRLLYRRFERHFDRMVQRHGRALRGLDLSNQPYNFSYAHFARLNRREEALAGAA